jgi:pepF/M3 family oligoendopeptidase
MYLGGFNMQHYWDLTTIYPSFTSSEYQGDMERLLEKIDLLNKLDLTTDFSTTAEKFIVQMNEIMALLFPLSGFASLSFSTDTTNEVALTQMNKMEETGSLLTAPVVKFQKWLATFSVDEIQNSSSPVVIEHTFYLTELHSKASHLLTDVEEVLLSKLQTVGSSAWGNLQGKLTSGLMLDFELNGETKPYSLSMIRNFANHGDAEVRKRAYETELAGYVHIEEAVCASLNAIKGEVNLISVLRGFESPLQESAYKARLDLDSLNAMIEAMKDKLPSFHKYLKRKASLLGHKGSLPFYDLFAPISSSSLTYTYDEAKEFVIENFGAFSKELADYATTAFDNNWVDVEPRQGKRGGAFCSHIRGKKQSRIMLNFDGSFSEVSTMAHELGHGYHNSQVYSETMLNAGYTMPVAETASIFCETIVTNAAIAKANKEDATFILEKSIEGATQVIVDILSRFIFEKNVFESRIEGPLSVEALKTIMFDAQKEAYGDGLDHENLHPYMWVCKPHYYSSGFSFYNYPYAFGLLFGKGLYAQYKAGRENFIEDYNKLLNNTTKMDVKTVAATMDIDITKKDFWLASLSMIEEEIEQFLELTK